MRRSRFAFAVVLFVWPAVAMAEPAPPEATPQTDDVEEDAGSYAMGETISLSGSARSMSSGWLIMPEGWEATGALKFLTSDAPPGGERMKLTDVVVSRAALRKSFGGKAELAIGVDLLPKQPSDTDENVFQAADLGVQYGIGRKSAVNVGVGGGPLANRDGVWTTAGAGLERRSIVHETLSFQLGLGGSVSNLAFDGGADHAVLGEVVTSVKTLFQIQDAFGLWFTGSFAFPVAHGGTLMGGAEFDPQTRVDVGVGMVYSLVDDWDVFMQLSVVDRGDLENPATTLPILQGGNDQKVFTFGVTRHFGQDDDGGDYDYLAYE
jgi:hypothetical protein